MQEEISLRKYPREKRMTQKEAEQIFDEHFQEIAQNIVRQATSSINFGEGLDPERISIFVKECILIDIENFWRHQPMISNALGQLVYPQYKDIAEKIDYIERMVMIRLYEKYACIPKYCEQLCDKLAQAIKERKSGIILVRIFDQAIKEDPRIIQSRTLHLDIARRLSELPADYHPVVFEFLDFYIPEQLEKLRMDLEENRESSQIEKFRREIQDLLAGSNLKVLPEKEED